MDAQAIYTFQNNSNDSGSPGNQRPGNSGSNGGGPRDSGTSLLVRSILIVVVVIVAWYLFQFFTSSNNGSNNANILEVPYSTFYQQVQEDNVASLTFQNQDAVGKFKNAITVTDASGASKTGTDFHFTQLPNGDPKLTELLIQHNVKFQAKQASDNNVPRLCSFLLDRTPGDPEPAEYL